MVRNSRSRFRTWRVVLLLPVVAVVMAAGIILALSRPFSVPTWDEAAPHAPSIYEPGDAEGLAVITPFRIETQPMQSLLLVNFEGDPDEIYRGLEPQAFDDEVHGRGLLVIGWRVDGRVDVFHDPALRLDPAMYGIAGSGLNAMVPRDLRDARLELDASGAQADFDFPDLEGRRVRLVVRESDTRIRRPFPLLAPMGAEAAEPPALPLVYVKDFYFVRRAGSEIRIEFDDRAHQSDAIPLILDGTRMHFVRYSARPFIVFWNPSHNRRAEILSPGAEAEGGAAPGEGTLPPGSVTGDRGVRYELTANGPFREIRRMALHEEGQEVTIEFEPAIPHLLALRDGADVSGNFRITTEPAAGTVTGTWRVFRQDRHLHFDVRPRGGWIPGDAPRMARLLFRAVPTFRRWPTTYAWEANLALPEPGADDANGLVLESTWERVEG